MYIFRRAYLVKSVCKAIDLDTVAFDIKLFYFSIFNKVIQLSRNIA